jgi:hypothetical protein
MLGALGVQKTVAACWALGGTGASSEHDKHAFGFALVGRPLDPFGQTLMTKTMAAGGSDQSIQIDNLLTNHTGKVAPMAFIR